MPNHQKATMPAIWCLGATVPAVWCLGEILHLLQPYHSIHMRERPAASTGNAMPLLEPRNQVSRGTRRYPGRGGTGPRNADA